MAAIEIFSSSVKYKYKSKICTLSTFFAFFFIILSILTPLFVIYNAGGFWLRNRVFVEAPNVSFAYKYLLLVERDVDVNPIVCSTFTTYKENKITDDCTLIKVQEIDTNSDGRNDILKFEAHFYTGRPIKTVKLLLIFSFQLTQLFEAIIESIAVFNYVLNQEIQELRFFGDLELHQKSLLHREGLYEIYNHSIEMADFTLHELLMHSASRKFSAKVVNEQVTWQTGYSSEDIIIIRGDLFYKEHLIHYQPGIWEELKWAWIQYLSFLLVFIYIAKHILVFLFSNRYMNTYIVVPWRNK